MDSSAPVVSTLSIKRVNENQGPGKEKHVGLPLLDHATMDLQEAAKNDESVTLEKFMTDKATKSTVSVHLSRTTHGDNLVKVDEPNTLNLTQNIALPHSEVPNVTNLLYPEHEVHQQEKIESLKNLKVCNHLAKYRI